MELLRRRRGIQQIGRGLGTLDREIFEAIAESPSPLIDSVMPRLTSAADHSKLWFAIAATPRRVGLSSCGTRRHPGCRDAGRDEPAHQPVREASLAAAAAQLGRRCRSCGGRSGCRRRTRCRPATRPARPRSPSASGWRARRWDWAWPCWPAWSACHGWPPARTTRVTCSPDSASARPSRSSARGSCRRSSRRDCGPPHPLRIDTPAREDGAGVVLVINPASGGGTGARVIDEVREALPKAEIVELGEDDDVVEALKLGGRPRRGARRRRR